MYVRTHSALDEGQIGENLISQNTFSYHILIVLSNTMGFQGNFPSNMKIFTSILPKNDKIIRFFMV